MKKTKTGYLAYVSAPTPARPHRTIRADGHTEEEALLNLTAKLVALGGPLQGEIKVVPLAAV